MLNLIADHPILFALFVCIVTGVPTALWWRWYSKKQQAANALASGIQFTCVCGKSFPSKMKFDSHQQDGTCPKHTVKPAVKPAHTNQTTKPVNKPSPLKKPMEEKPIQKSQQTTPKALRKSIKIKPRKKQTETINEKQAPKAKKQAEDVISINEFAKSKNKIVISKR